MGNIISYQGEILGDISKGRWRQMCKLLPLLIEYVNEAMALDWGEGTARNVTLFTGGTVPQLPVPSNEPPPPGRFSLEAILNDESNGMDEITIINRDELRRLFCWCGFLSQRDGSYELYRPLVEVLQRNTVGN